MKKFRYSIYLLILSGCFGVLLGMLKNLSINNDSRNYMQCRIKYEGFDNELDNADVILIGEVNNITEYPKYDELSVKINKVEKGIIKEDIQIRNYLYDYSYTYNNKEYSGQTNTKYQTGEKYLFILQHIENVYEDKYVILSDIYIPISTNEKSSILSNPIDDITDPIEYVESYNYKNIIGLGKELSVDYIKSKDTNTIIQESPYIAEIIPKMLYETTETVDVYLCDVVESLKGTINSTEENQIIVPFFKNTVKEEKNYIVYLNADTVDSYIYFLSSTNSLLSINEKANVTRILEELK